MSYAYHLSLRCGARTKHNNGNPCRSPAVRGKQRCRMHGGAKGSGGQPENKNALKHGLTTTIIKNFRKSVREIIKECQRPASNLS